jgi:hypothetical protein
MTWAALPLDQVNRNPLTRISTPPNAPSRLFLNRTREHLENLEGLSRPLLTTLTMSPNAINGHHVRLAAFRAAVEENNPAWFGIPELALFALDDAWQVHAALTGAKNCLGLWQRASHGLVDSESVPKPRDLPYYLDWIQDLFDTRALFAQEAVERAHDGGEAIRNFYDPAQRAAKNMRRGAEAVTYYFNPR